MQERQLAEVASSQHSLLTREQALGVVTQRQLESRLNRGRLVLVRSSVYRVGGAAESWEQHLLAACLAAGPDAVASFRAAAALWDLDGFGRQGLEITIATRRRVRLEGVVVHRSLVTGRLHTARIDRIPVTSVARTLCDLTAVLEPWRVERLVNEADCRRLVTVRQIKRVFRELETRGRRRSTVMRAILESRLEGIESGDSHPEVRVAKLLRRRGLAAVQQHRVRIGNRTVRVDLAFPELKIAIEYDGWDAHRTRGAFDADRARANELEVRGWLVLRFTSRSTPDVIVDTVSAALRARYAEHGSIDPPLAG